jgi:hypothetical protein
LDFPWLGKCGVLFLLDYIFTLDFPWLDLSRDYLLRTVRLPLQRDPFISYLRIIPVLGVFQGLCGV